MIGVPHDDPAALQPTTPTPHFGPYVSAEGGEIEATVIVKAAPEDTKSHGITVCTAAILDDGRLIRLYPVQWDEYKGAREEIRSNQGTSRSQR